jgi:hypothetical protein
MADPLKQLQLDLDRRLHRAARLLLLEHRKDLSRPFPKASRPGQYPKRRTGTLEDSVTLKGIPDGYRVFYNTGEAPYVVYLVAHGRKALLDTLRRVLPQMAKAVGGK